MFFLALPTETTKATISTSTNPVANQLHQMRLCLIPIYHHSAWKLFPTYFWPVHCLKLARNTFLVSVWKVIPTRYYRNKDRDHREFVPE